MEKSKNDDYCIVTMKLMGVSPTIINKNKVTVNLLDTAKCNRQVKENKIKRSNQNMDTEEKYKLENLIKALDFKLEDFVKEIIFDKPYTTVVFKNGETSTAICSEHDIFDEAVGFSVAFARGFTQDIGELHEFVEDKKVIKLNQKQLDSIKTFYTLGMTHIGRNSNGNLTLGKVNSFNSLNIGWEQIKDQTLFDYLKPCKIYDIKNLLEKGYLQ